MAVLEIVNHGLGIDSEKLIADSGEIFPRERQILRRYLIFMNNHPVGAEFRVQSSGIRFPGKEKAFDVLIMQTRENEPVDGDEVLIET